MIVHTKVQRKFSLRNFFNKYGWPHLDKMGQAISQGRTRNSEEKKALRASKAKKAKPDPENKVR